QVREGVLPGAAGAGELADRDDHRQQRQAREEAELHRRRQRPEALAQLAQLIEQRLHRRLALPSRHHRQTPIRMISWYASTSLLRTFIARRIDTSAFSRASDISCRLPPPSATFSAWASASSCSLSTLPRAPPSASVKLPGPSPGRATSRARGSGAIAPAGPVRLPMLSMLMA